MSHVTSETPCFFEALFTTRFEFGEADALPDAMIFSSGVVSIVCVRFARAIGDIIATCGATTTTD